MATKKVARIVINTKDTRYLLTVPNIDAAGTRRLIDDAKRRSRTEREAMMFNWVLIFEFENERLDIMENILNIHYFIKDENYAFDTPTIHVHNR